MFFYIIFAVVVFICIFSWLVLRVDPDAFPVVLLSYLACFVGILITLVANSQWIAFWCCIVVLMLMFSFVISVGNQYNRIKEKTNESA